MENCIFCGADNHDVSKERVLYTDAYSSAVLDLYPHAPGHTLIIPKKHYRSIIEIPEADLRQLIVTVKKMAQRIAERLQPDGLTIGWNHGRMAGQIIDHLHIHIMPRFEGDGGGSVHSVVNNPPKESFAEMRKKLT